MQTHRTDGQISTSGRLSQPNEGNALMAAVILFALIAGAIFYFTYSAAPQPQNAGPTRTVIETGDSTPSEFPANAAGDDAASSFPTTPESGTVNRDPTLTSPFSTTFYGRIVDAEGGAIVDATVRVFGPHFSEPAYYLHDEAFLAVPLIAGGPDELSSMIDGAAQVVTSADGSFEIEAALGKLLSISAPGLAPRLVQISERKTPSVGIDDIDFSDFGTGQDSFRELSGLLSRNSGVDSVAPTATEEDRREITLAPATMLTGTVRSTTDRSPAVGAQITVSPKRDMGAMAAMISGLTGGVKGWVNEAGSYAILIDEPGSYSVGALTGVSNFAPTPRDAYPSLLVEPGDVQHVMDFNLTPGGAIEGVVVDEAGSPLEGARIMVMVQLELTEISSGFGFGNLDPRTAESGADGTFQVRGLPLGSAYNTAAEIEGFARTTVTTDELNERYPVASVRLIAIRGSTISGTVISEDGSPLPGVMVQVLPDFEELMRGGTLAATNLGVTPVNSGEDGTFQLENMPAGVYNLVAGDAIANYNPFGGDSTGEKVEVDGVTDLIGVLLVAAAEPEDLRGDLSGLVVDSAGAPLRGARITITEQFLDPVETSSEDSDGDETEVVTSTDARGRFFAPGAAVADVMIHAELAGYSSSSELLTAGQTEITLTLEVVATIRGRVLLADGSPLGVKFRVSAEEVSEDGSASMETQLTNLFSGGLRGVSGNEDGTFELTEVPVGTVEVVATASGFAKGRSAPIVLSAGDVVEGIEIFLTRGARIFGQVIDPSGSPLAGAKVLCTPADTAGGMSDLMAQAMPAFFAGGNTITTHDDGTYEVTNLAPGEYVIRALHERFARSEPVKITVSGEREFSAPKIAMLVGGVVEGHVTRDGKPVAGLMVQIFSKGAMKQGITRADGAYRMENLPDGDYAVMFMDLTGSMRPGGGSGMRTRMAEVVAGEVSTIDVAFGTGRTVRGTITNAPDVPMKMLTLRIPGGPAPEDSNPLDMELAMESARYQVAMAILGPEGEFEIVDVEPGEYILEMPRMPEDPTDMQAYATMNRMPYVRKTITVGSSDITVHARAD